MRHGKDFADDIEDRERWGYALGEVHDFLVRQETRTLDREARLLALVERLATGRTTLAAARIAIQFETCSDQLESRNAMKDVDDWRKWWGWRAKEGGFPYLHKELSFRIIAPLPDGVA